MKVLVACEESQVVCKEFRKLGHEAYSCDLLPCSGGHPEWHFMGDCVEFIPSIKWDMIIFHPDCTAMAVSGNRWYGQGMPRHNKRIEDLCWTMETWELIKDNSRTACLENPVSVIFSEYPKKLIQYVQPWQFGHGETKKTGLMLHNLPHLKPTNIVSGREHRIWKMPPSENRKRLRSITFSGIAEAMAEQWSNL
jgi:hypothetical protein